MKKVKVYVNDKQRNSNGEFTVYLSISDGKDSRIRVATGLYCKHKFVGREFPSNEPNHNVKTTRLNLLYSQIEDFILRNEDTPLKDLKSPIMEILGRKERVFKSLADYCNEYASKQKTSTAKLYTLTADRIIEYDARAKLDDISKEWLQGFEKHLRDNNKLSVNGIAQKMRNIRTVLNWCIDEGITNNYPFRGRNGYKIKEEETVPNALTAQEFANLRDYPCEEWQRIYLDMFCLSVYLAGVNVGDLLLCEGLTNGRFVFVRRKTNKSNSTVIRKIDLPVCKEAKTIIKKYKGKNHLLNIMDSISDYHTFMQHWNKALKKIGPSKTVKDKVGRMRKIEREPLFPNITTYTARYTFASIAANDLDISESTIGKCLGHSWAQNKQVTSRYISHDQKKIDDAIEKVIKYLNSFTGIYK